ncbi:MAG: methyltransferase domain-containing protein [Pseudomonadota bacterium]
MSTGADLLESQEIQELQDYGKNPIAVRETDKYKEEYIEDFVDRWDSLIDWDARAKSEGDFFIDLLRSRGAEKVLDVATGTGFHSVRLLEAGFDVVSVDGSSEMLVKAFENGQKRGHILRTVHADWRLLNCDINEKFDAIICLGNSFTHLFKERDRRKALAEFYAALRHDGILIMDQRNYDQILDDGYSSKHKFYYCGDDVEVEPIYIDDGLTRFRYAFSDNSAFYLNMFPLRKNYLREFMTGVGFQKIDTYGDFQETYRQSAPDFYIHVADKTYVIDADEKGEDNVEDTYSSIVETARTYYNSNDADNFYATIWGGEDIHIGLYEAEQDSIFDASHRTVEKMTGMLSRLNVDQHVLDLGSGYGGSARHLVKAIGCQVDCLNLSEVQNKRNRRLNNEQGLATKINVIDGSFEAVPAKEYQYDVVWSQDALLHSGNRRKVLEEARRLLKAGGSLIFTDPMQSDDCPEGVLQPVYDRLHLDSLGSVKFYQENLEELGFELVEFVAMPNQLITHYSRILSELEGREAELANACSKEYVERMKTGLRNWVEAGNKGYLNWGILHFRKMSL